MKELLVQYANNKFINNIALSTTDYCNKTVVETKGLLYKLYYDKNITDIIFNLSMLSREELTFIEEFGSIVNIYVYNDTSSECSQIDFIQNIRGILQKEKEENSKNKIISIPKLVNKEIFFTDENTIKNNDIVFFMDTTKNIPDKLHEYLYPNTQMPIKLFNNSNIIHPQNLGMVSEQDKGKILQQASYYLAINDDYVPEAWACGCVVLVIDDLPSLKPSVYRITKSFQPYSNFLKVLLKC